MNMQTYIDEIKLDVTGGVLELEIDDTTLQKIINSAMREVQRYICSTKLVTLPYKECIDLKDYNINAIARIYRAQGAGTSASAKDYSDPLQASLFQITSTHGNLYNLNDFTYNYGSWNTLQQIRNTLSTDLAYYYDDDTKKLYINTSLDRGANVTVEYIPRYENVEEITSDFWIDVIMRMSKALTKIALGRIRGRFTQTNALWTSDAAEMLQEGQNELGELRAYLQKNTQLIYPKD